MPREGQIARILRIIQLMASRKTGVTVGELAKEEDCSPRTIYRDLEAIQLAGFPVYNEKEGNSTLWRFVDGYRLYMPIPFDVQELMALYYSRGMFHVFKGTVFHDSLESLVKKIRNSLSQETLNLIERFEHVFSYGQRPVKDYGHYREIVNQVNKACSERRQIEMIYYTLSRDAESQRRVDPYRIWYFEGALYLIGHCRWRDEVRMFSIDRIRLVTITRKTFQVPEDFSVEEYMANCFKIIHDELVHVEVRFTGDAVLWVVDKKWHPSQQIKRNRDGSITASFDVGGTSEIKSWILSFGPMARVLEPKSLAEEIVEDASRMTELYKKSPAWLARTKKR